MREATSSFLILTNISYVIVGIVVAAKRSSDLSILGRQLLELKLQLNNVLLQLTQSCKVEVIHKTDLAISPLLTTDGAKARSLSPKARPADLRLSNSPASRHSSGSIAQLSPVTDIKGGPQSPSASASGDEASKSPSDGEAVTVSSAL